jgi:hypothetical protein
MKYQKELAIVGGVTAAVVGVMLLRNFLQRSGGFNVSGVTATKKDGITGGTISTTPIKTSDVAYVAPASTLSLIIGKVASGINSVIPSGQSRLPASAKLTPFGSARAATAAYNSPIQGTAANYRPSSWAGLTPR